MNAPLFRLFVLAVFATVLLILPNAVEACRAECETAIGCYGSCEIDPPEACGSVCHTNGCNKTCRLVGPGTACSYDLTSPCNQRPPIYRGTAPEQPEVSWAVLEVSGAAAGDAQALAVLPLAGSSTRFADEAAAAVRHQAIEESATTHPVPSDTRTVFYLDSVSGSPAKVSFEVDHRPAKLELAEPAVIFFRGRLDDDGLSSIEILWSDPATNLETVQSLASLIEVRTSLEYTLTPTSSVEIYALFGVAEGQPWGALQGAFALPR